MSLSIINKLTKGKPPRLPFVKIKEDVLGKEYELSLVFIGSTRSKTLNKRYRGKNYPANVLSFPLSDEAGEIFIDLKEAKKHHNEFDVTSDGFVGLLFIHGLLHLEGFEHSSNMEYKEEKMRKKFDIK